MVVHSKIKQLSIFDEWCAKSGKVAVKKPLNVLTTMENENEVFEN